MTKFEELILDITQYGYNVTMYKSNWLVSLNNNVIFECSNDSELLLWWQDTKGSYTKDMFIEDINEAIRLVRERGSTADVLGILSKIKESVSPSILGTINVPSGWRIGQYIFNLLEFIKNETHQTTIDYGMGPTTNRLADTFHMPDHKIIELLKQYNNKINNQICQNKQ